MDHQLEPIDALSSEFQILSSITVPTMSGKSDLSYSDGDLISVLLTNRQRKLRAVLGDQTRICNALELLHERVHDLEEGIRLLRDDWLSDGPVITRLGVQWMELRAYQAGSWLGYTYKKMEEHKTHYEKNVRQQKKELRREVR